MKMEPTFQAYYQQIDRITRERLDKEDPDYLLRVDFDEYLNFLVDEAKWEPLLWDESQKTVEPFSSKCERRDEFHSGQIYQVEEQRIRLRIPISHHPQRAEYLKLAPQQHGLDRQSQIGNLKVTSLSTRLKQLKG